METRPLSRRTAAAVLFSLVASLGPSVGVAAFVDVSASSENRQAIEVLQADGVVEGYADGTFGAGRNINRAEFLTIIARALNADVTSAKEGCFPDVRGTWFAQTVCWAHAKNIVSGDPDGNFAPERNINFAEASKILTLAFGQNLAQGGSDWFEQYVRALEASRAIPKSIDAFGEFITRGDMAEMLWRLTYGVDDRPSKGYLNVKYPELAVDLSSDAIQNAKSCRDIQAIASAAGSAGYGYDMFNKGVVPPQANVRAQESDAAAPASALPLTGGGTGDYSQTNIQVEGVDEGDIVKTDGTHLYIAGPTHGSTISIVKAVPGSAMQKTATIDLGGQNVIPQELYVDGNRLVVVGQGWANSPYAEPMPDFRSMEKMMIYPGYQSGRTEARIYDIADKANPKLVRALSFDGNRVSTRRIDDTLYLVMNRNLWRGGPMPLRNNATEADAGMPTFTDSVTNGGKDQPVARCGTVSILPHVPQPEYLIVAAVPLTGTSSEVKREVVLGSAQNIYASAGNLYVATPRWRYSWDGKGDTSVTTQLYRFGLGANVLDLEAEGSVPGTVLNQFSMDESRDIFRIATTIPQSWDRTDSQTSRPSANNLYTLNMNLDRLGEIENIAPGESIYSVRFMGNRAYMVTFKQVDPLFVIDLADPRTPKILGKLKIPGYSDYLHPYDETHVIGFGKEVDESIGKDKVHTDDAVYYTAVLGMKVAMFDVSDVANPKELFKEVIGDRGTESPLLRDHHALLFDRSRNLLSFPVTVMEFQNGQQPSDENAWPVATFQGAYVYDFSLAGIKLRGKISHYSADEYLKSGDTWYPSGKDVERIVRIGESLYTISPNQVQSHGEKDVKLQGSVGI